MLSEKKRKLVIRVGALVLAGLMILSALIGALLS